MVLSDTTLPFYTISVRVQVSQPGHHVEGTDKHWKLEMIELNLSQEEWIKFIALAKKEMTERGLSVNDLADGIGRPRGSVRNFFSKNSNHSRFLAAEIAEYLGMKRGGRK